MATLITAALLPALHPEHCLDYLLAAPFITTRSCYDDSPVSPLCQWGSLKFISAENIHPLSMVTLNPEPVECGSSCFGLCCNEDGQFSLA